MSKCQDCGKGNHNKNIVCWNCGSKNLVAKKKNFDRDAVYAKTVKFYLGKGKTLDEANKIAQKIVEDQQKVWQQKTSFNF